VDSFSEVSATIAYKYVILFWAIEELENVRVISLLYILLSENSMFRQAASKLQVKFAYRIFPCGESKKFQILVTIDNLPLLEFPI
jgi:hypothetical protein